MTSRAQRARALHVPRVSEDPASGLFRKKDVCSAGVRPRLLRKLASIAGR